MFRKVILTIVSIMCIILFISCGKKEKPKEIIYNGSVMLFSDMDVEIIKAIKTDFESSYKGVVLDYFNNDINTIKNKIDDSYDLDLPEADVVLSDDINIFNKLSTNKWLNQYVSKENKSIVDDYKVNGNDYHVVGIKNGNKYMVAILSNSLNIDNGKLLIDYLLSKKGQELLVKSGIQTVRKDIK